MRVLVATGVYPPEIGGPATYSVLLEAGLAKEGVSVEVLPFRSVRGYPKVFRHIVYFWKVLTHARGVDIIFALDPMSVGLPALCASFFMRKKFLLKVVGDYAWEQASQRFGYTGTLELFQSADLGGFAQLFRSLERFVACRAVRVIVPSKYLGNIVKAWGVPEEHITVIYNGVSVGDVGKKETIRGVLHFEGLLLVSVGRLVPWKGFDVLIRVFAKLRKKFPSLTLFIVGSGPDLDSLMQVAREAGVEGEVIFAGQVDRGALLRYFRAADVFALNTSYEGFSHLILEAMAVGVPVVTTNVGGNPEVIREGVDGYLVQPNDAKLLEARISKLLADETLRERIVRSARSRVSEFTDPKMLKETAALITSL